jgi:prepilin-type N-terminal cleavage/methylation domain-containing protein
MRNKNSIFMRGFTVIEVLVVLLIFSVAMLGGMKLLKITVQSNDYAEDLLEAISWGKSTIENLKMIPLYKPDHPEQLNDGIFGDEVSADIKKTYDSNTGLGSTTYFYRKWNVYSIPGSDSKRVVVTIWWDDKGTTRYYTTTFIKGRISG